MNTTSDISNVRPTNVAFVNCHDATTFGRTVYMTAYDERRLRRLLASLHDYGLVLRASFEPVLANYGFGDAVDYLRSSIGAHIVDAALAAGGPAVPGREPEPVAVMPMWASSRRAGARTRCSARRGCGAPTCWSRRYAWRMTTIRCRCLPCGKGSSGGPTRQVLPGR